MNLTKGEFIRNNMMFIIIIVLIVFAITTYMRYRVINKKNYLEIKEEKVERNFELTAIIETEKGSINIKLMPDVAPVTVVNFVNLANRSYYDGLKFHRVIEEFMIQGGDPTGTGMGGPGYNFKDEFKEGVVFDSPGYLAMANAGPNTNGSQFFITHISTEWLNYKHSIFGKVLSEDDQAVVNKIEQGDLMKSIKIQGEVEEFLKEYADVVAQFNESLDK